eukprot:Gb_32131 [translate_table: standard]
MIEVGSSSMAGRMMNVLSAILCFTLMVSPMNAAVFNASGSHDLPGIQLPSHPQSMFDNVATSCDQFSANYNNKDKPKAKEEEEGKKDSVMRVKLMHRDSLKPESTKKSATSRKDSLIESCARDRSRAQAFHERVLEKTTKAAPHASADNKKNNDYHGLVSEKPSSGKNYSTPSTPTAGSQNSTRVIATLESGASVGSGEYFMDVFIGTPPRHFSLILDTGSDLNWVQCLPCEDCYEQEGPLYNPLLSSSYNAIPCTSPECNLVTPPETQNGPKSPESNSSCKYFYWYGDRSNTTGELAYEKFTVNITEHKHLEINKVMFGCGHANRGLFHGAAGLLGLGRGQLSFTSQLQKIYGRKFSYCLVDRNDNMSVSSTLVFGEDTSLKTHPDLQYTALLTSNITVDTFYYVQIDRITVGGENLNISSHVWDINTKGYGGTIVDSGTTLTYFPQPAYEAIQAAFEAKISGYPRVELPLLSPCYNVSGVNDIQLPEFSIVFRDGAVWRFPADNYFIQLDPEDSVICLAIMGSPAASLSILGNYQQQNFHILYDVDNSRLGFAPVRCDSM